MRTIGFVGLLGLVTACRSVPPAVVPPVTPAFASASSPGPSATSGPAVAPAAPSSPSSPSSSGGDDRFDMQVRDDFFDGLRGDDAALDRVIRFCEATLAEHPEHAEALVWHGAALIGRARGAFRSGDPATGRALYGKGLGEMDRAVALAPDRVGVRLPRGAVVLTAAQFVPEPEKSRLLARGVGDFEIALAAQAPRFGTMSLHAREQLLYGLTDGYAGLGELTKARTYYQRMVADAAGSQLLGRARTRAAGEAVAGPTPCEQCHGR